MKKTETDLFRILSGIFLMLGGIGTYKMWINYPIPKDFWGSIFMNFGAVYPAAGIVAVCVGAYLIMTADIPTSKKEATGFLSDNVSTLLLVLWATSIFYLPYFMSKDIMFYVFIVSGILVLIHLFLKKGD